jgi:phage shock protein A
MSILSRMKRVSTGKLEIFLARAEDPELIFPQLIREMEEQVRLATEAEAKALASKKSLEHTRELLDAKLLKMGQGAESALLREDEALAREALEAQMKLEAERERSALALATSAEALASARAAREDAQTQLREIRAKKDELLTRARVVRTRENIQQTLSGPVTSSHSILDAVAAMEGKVEEREAKLAVQSDLAQTGSTSAAASSLERRIDALNHADELNRRMEALKSKLKTKV